MQPYCCSQRLSCNHPPAPYSQAGPTGAQPFAVKLAVGLPDLETTASMGQQQQIQKNQRFWPPVTLRTCKTR